MYRHMLYRDLFAVPVLCGFIVQVLKVLIYSAVRRMFDLEKLFQTDGMPNLHSAVFASLSAVVGIKYGFSSLIFSMTTIFCVIILHDTMRLKRQKEKQVDALNTIISSIKEYESLRVWRITRVLQYRPLDVICGAALGVILTYLLM